MFAWYVIRKNSVLRIGKSGAALLLTGILGSSSAFSATYSSSVGVSAQQYAPDSGPASRVDFDTTIRSQENLSDDSKIARGELHVYSFFETDSSGDRSFDLDRTVFRFNIGDNSHLWLGRNHPLHESFESNEVKSTSAVGANWVQNQSNALEPRVSGWLGFGIHSKDSVSGFFGTAAYSPIFLPDFGPGVDFSDTVDAKGVRFAHLPPAYISINDQPVPLRYRILADTAAIVGQSQFFAAFGHEAASHRATVMAWSAPAPNPKTNAVGLLRVNPKDVDALVTVTPTFEREKFVGTQLSLFQIPLLPSLEAVYESVSGRLTVSGSIKPFRFLEAGYLDTFQKESVSDSSSPVSSPLYGKHLAWAEASVPSMRGKLTSSLRIEQHLSGIEQGRWIHPSVSYRTDDQLTLFAGMSVLTGTDFSYFGAWRSLDSVSMGAKYQW